MSFVLDAVVIALIAIFAIIAAKKGFVRSLIEFVGYILALIIAVTVSGALADLAYAQAVRPAVVDAVTSVLQNEGEAVYESIPGSVASIMELAGIDLDSISLAVGETADEAAARVADTVVKPLAVGIVKSLSIIIIAVILFIVVGILAKLINALFKGVLLGTANTVLGAVLGGAKGIIFAALFCVIVSFITSVSESDFLFFSREAIDSSFLCKYILQLISVTF